VAPVAIEMNVSQESDLPDFSLAQFSSDELDWALKAAEFDED